MGPGVAAEPGGLFGQRGFGLGGAIPPFEHAGRKLGEERAGGQTRSGNGGGEGRSHAGAIEDVRRQGGEPEGPVMEPGEGGLAAHPGKQRARGDGIETGRESGGGKGDAQLAHGHGTAPGEAVVAGAEDAEYDGILNGAR